MTLNSPRRTEVVTAVGAGLAVLIAAEMLAAAGHRMEVFDATASARRRLLLAGMGRPDFTHGEPVEAFVSRRSMRSPVLGPVLREVGAYASRPWLHRLRRRGARLPRRHCWLGWADPGESRFDTPQGALSIKPKAAVLAPVGASWPQLGSDGASRSCLQARVVDPAPLQPSHCGFDVERLQRDIAGTLTSAGASLSASSRRACARFCGA